MLYYISVLLFEPDSLETVSAPPPSLWILTNEPQFTIFHWARSKSFPKRILYHSKRGPYIKIRFLIASKSRVRLTSTCLSFESTFPCDKRSQKETVTCWAKWTLCSHKTRAVSVLHKKFESVIKKLEQNHRKLSLS